MSSPIKIARQLRQEMTREEKRLWQELRAHRFKSYKFRRQHPIIYETIGWQKNFYIADFFCASCRLVLELDGKHHEWTDQKEYDRARDIIMSKMGMKILRIKNEELAEIKEVLKKIELSL